MMRRRGAALAAMALMIGAGVGCGSDDDSSSSGGAAANSSDSKLSAQALADVQSTVDKHLKRPGTTGITEPVDGVPKGKTLHYVYVSTPVAATTAKSAREAAKALGWRFRQTAVKPTPEGFQSGFEAALRDADTDAIVSTSLPIQTIQQQIKKAAARDIPIVILSPDRPTSGNLLGIGGPANYEYAGKLEADYILSRTKGDAQVLLAVPSALPTIKILADSFKAEWKKQCPSCPQPKTYDAPVTSFGSTFPGLLTAHLQANRDVDWIVFGFNDMLTGVPGALKAAGLNDLKAVTWAQGPQSNPLLGKGLLEAQVGVPIVELPWVAVDGLIRYFNKQPVTPMKSFLAPGAPAHWIITKESMDAAGLDPKGSWPLNPNYAQEFKQLWGATS